MLWLQSGNVTYLPRMAKSMMHLLNIFSIARFNCIAEGTGNIDFHSLELQGGASSSGIVGL
jgi:hypothetical protein